MYFFISYSTESVSILLFVVSQAALECMDMYIQDINACYIPLTSILVFFFISAMVLKKSNSGLNTGATQRVHRGCFVNLFRRLDLRKTAGAIGIDVELVGVDVTEEVDDCMSQIYDYLEFSGPRGSNFSSTAIARNVHPQWKRGTEVSLSKGNNWHLRQRISALRNDIDFLKEISSTIQINFAEKHNHLGSSRFQDTTKTTTSTQIIKSFESEERERERAKSKRDGIKTRERVTYHGRGVQRKHNARVSRASARIEGTQDDDVIEEKKSTLTFTFFEPCSVDARGSKLCEHDRHSYNARHGQKSYNKCKGFVNGTRSSHREQYFDVKANACDPHRANPQKAPTQEDICIGEDIGEEVSGLPCAFRLEDFIAKEKDIKFKRKCRKPKHAESSLTKTEANAFDKPRHPKGSYIYINNDQDQNSSLSQSSWEVVDLESCEVSASPNDEQNKISHDRTDKSAADQTRLEQEQNKPSQVLDTSETAVYDLIDNLEKEFELFKDSFIHIHALMPGDGVSLFPETSEKLRLDGRPNVTVGDSFPHCFCVSSPSYPNKSYVVARRASLDGKTWLILLQGSSESQDIEFRSKLSHLAQAEEHVSLNQVVNIAEETLNDSQHVQELVSIDNKFSSNSRSNCSKLNLWNEMDNMTRQEVSIHTAEQAAEKIEASSNRSQNLGTTCKQIDSFPLISEDIECGVCFSLCNLYGKCDDESAMMLSSCGHAHCISCWRAHVYHTIRNGAPRITCMATGCDTVMDETTLKCLVPATLVRSWQTRLRDRLLQTSDFTSWCPDPRCGHVAVSSRAPLKKQFGTPVVCSCSRRWCSNCQEDPHWPTSCDQMAVYKKLLFKTGNNSEVPVAHASYAIDLKRCPKCKYPIEKNQGCPSMVCRMCWFNFCWNCLQSTEKHNVYSCKVSPSSNFVTFHLNNNLVYDLPIKFFLESVQANRQCELINQKYHWLEKLRRSVKLRSSLHGRLRARQVGNFSHGADEDSSLELIADTLAFLKRAVTQIELFYVLLGFVQLNKTKPTLRLIAAVKSKMSRLQFAVDRLNIHVVGRSLHHICAVHNRARALLKTGATTLEEISTLAPLLQQTSKDVETAWVGNIDPSKHLRYK